MCTCAIEMKEAYYKLSLSRHYSVFEDNKDVRKWMSQGRDDALQMTSVGCEYRWSGWASHKRLYGGRGT